MNTEFTDFKDIDLNKEENIKYIYNNSDIKIIELTLDIKHAEIGFSSTDDDDGIQELQFSGPLPTDYKDYNKYVAGEMFVYIKVLEGYEYIGVSTDKYDLILTLIKNKN